MEIRTDFKELLELFNKRKVEYLIVGGYALAFHASPCVTGDIDLFVRQPQSESHFWLRAKATQGSARAFPRARLFKQFLAGGALYKIADSR